MAPFDKTRLKKALTRLEAAASGLAGRADPPEIAQEILDFLAMMAGLKPVFMMGRGIDGPGWQGAIRALAADAGLTAIEGPLWDATPWQSSIGEIVLPHWYADHSRTELAGLTAIAICRTKSIAAAIDSVNSAGGQLTMAEEARLLGYPPCCVKAHYERALRYHRATLSMLRRLGKGDPAKMRALLTGGANRTPVTDDEIVDLDTAFAIDPAPFGSWNRCSHCADGPTSPSNGLSKQYRKLAFSVSADFVRMWS